MDSDKSLVDELFKAIENESEIHLHPSPVPLTIEDNSGTFKGYYAFYSSGAVRLELSEEDVVGAAVWTKPGNLNKPDFHINLRGLDPHGEVDTIVKLMIGRGSALVPTDEFKEHTRIQEDAAGDVDAFFNSIGGYAYDKKLSDLYISYEQWASVHNKRQLSKAYFVQLGKEWLIKHKKYASLEITKGNIEKTEVNSSQEDTFMNDVLENEPYYKVGLAEHSLKRMAQNDPLINAIFLCGTSGMGKTTLVKRVLKEAGVWEKKVVYKEGAIAGFTGLLQVLWENRKGRILVLDDNDNLLVRPDQQTVNILKAALKTDSSGRTISYTRMKRKNARA